ncbi:MAG TPA: hypothetical protein VGM11_08125 [Acidobacteriaceae bacterium]|jgi:hypothetical protein
MTDLPPKPTLTRKTGLSPKEQKLQALREKLANGSNGAKPGTAHANGAAGGFQGKSTTAGRKTAFQRKAT